MTTMSTYSRGQRTSEKSLKTVAAAPEAPYSAVAYMRACTNS